MILPSDFCRLMTWFMPYSLFLMDVWKLFRVPLRSVHTICFTGLDYPKKILFQLSMGRLLPLLKWCFYHWWSYSRGYYFGMRHIPSSFKPISTSSPSFNYSHSEIIRVRDLAYRSGKIFSLLWSTISFHIRPISLQISNSWGIAFQYPKEVWQPLHFFHQ